MFNENYGKAQQKKHKFDGSGEWSERSEYPTELLKQSTARGICSTRGQAMERRSRYSAEVVQIQCKRRVFVGSQEIESNACIVGSYQLAAD